ncbi:FMN-binding negative transcriptional regulator [Rhodohalobacter sp. 614A]|uniref:FMN-binding negative transcriptional regulator n=1 Tax=Rhodohalobacter sp. 614A TaxID=2908649 RepID=UPI001F3A0F68|nr:FMN-binding negative transcriptional regulator [Rhodohalobacter sp. 614A]
MYQKDKYVKNDPEYVYEFINAHPFATFVLNGDRLLATHIPVLADGDPKNFRLFSHISNEYNEQIKYLENGREALLIFHGAQAYVSSSWYKRKGVSTWDYSAVHVNVRLKIQSGNDLEESLKKLVRRFEQEQDSPLYYDEIPDKMVKGLIPHITGFWAEPFKIEAIAKLHQGYKKEDVDSTINHLRKQQDPSARRLVEDIRREHESDQNQNR